MLASHDRSPLSGTGGVARIREAAFDGTSARCKSRGSYSAKSEGFCRRAFSGATCSAPRRSVGHKVKTKIAAARRGDGEARQDAPRARPLS